MADRPTERLPEPEWTRRREAYRDRLDHLLAPLLRDARSGDPVPQFLFDYYGLRPGRLRRWHPGFGTVLLGDRATRDYRTTNGYIIDEHGTRVGEEHLARKIATIRFTAGLLRATAARPARLNCFGLHEWAMIYRLSDGAGRRHSQVPLRVSQETIDQTVEALPLRCTHFDAYRFFTAAAAPRNELRLDRAGQTAREQPGCLHANMDLFKWSSALSPLVGSELVLSCLELAAAAREVDMRASPYDLRAFGYDPITVETAGGRAEYAQHQSRIAERAAPLRSALLAECETLLTATGDD